MRDRPFPWPTVGGYDYYEVVSALQKSIRRGLEEDALFWATELYMSDYAPHAWGRLLVIASEDVGPAQNSAVLVVKALHGMWSEEKKSGEARLWFVHAVLALVRAPKSRIVDHATITFFEGERENKQVPDWALDVHTKAGRAKERGYEHFFDEGATLRAEALEDPYKRRARGIRCGKDKKKS